MPNFENRSAPNSPENPWRKYANNDEVRAAITKIADSVLAEQHGSQEEAITRVERKLQESGYPGDVAALIFDTRPSLEEGKMHARMRIEARSPLDHEIIKIER